MSLLKNILVQKGISSNIVLLDNQVSSRIMHFEAVLTTLKSSLRTQFMFESLSYFLRTSRPSLREIQRVRASNISYTEDTSQQYQ